MPNTNINVHGVTKVRVSETRTICRRNGEDHVNRVVTITADGVDVEITLYARTTDTDAPELDIILVNEHGQATGIDRNNDILLA